MDSPIRDLKSLTKTIKLTTGEMRKCRCGKVILYIETTKDTSCVDHSSMNSMVKTKESSTHPCMECWENSKRSEVLKHEEKKEKVPFAERCRVINAGSSTSDRESGSAEPLPKEISIRVEGYTDENLTEIKFQDYTGSSGQGFEGILTSPTRQKIVPKHFTFDGIVPSVSSGCDSIRGNTSPVAEDILRCTGKFSNGAEMPERRGRYNIFSPTRAEVAKGLNPTVLESPIASEKATFVSLGDTLRNKQNVNERVADKTPKISWFGDFGKLLALT